ncbi:hypothetical protein Dsin_019684 [Dipteronia sinensis]|uniref:RNase H type-1 domain-containing protein n=1 Tax=Dipteronia sinensis TaxID=43782 RepID=A0AAE0A928_9ROSI|nr:hypothetical protein Dsin_019684 [Dipteronia sinensis]
MDGATLSSPGVGGCGGVFQNCRAFMNGCFVVPLGQMFMFEVVLIVASMAINYVWKYGWRQIWLESDSSYVVQLPFSRSGQVSHICREGNQVMDALSKHALGLEIDAKWFSTMSFFSMLVDSDYMGRESFRFS